jgi:hypothetical protein
MEAFGRMKPSIKAKWIAALRGGLYKQGKGALRDKRNRCCCLGVLCDQVAPGSWKKKGFFWSATGNWEHKGDWGIISDGLARKVGLTPIEVQNLIGMNDYDGLTFKQIADVIESGELRRHGSNLQEDLDALR